MGAVLAVGSLIGALGPTVGVTTLAGISVGTIGTVAGIVGTFVSGIEQSRQQRAAGKAEQAASEFRARELQLKGARESTQSAIEEADRQRRLRISLATQRARFAAGGIDPQTGTPLRIQEASISEILRQDRQAGLFSSLSISALNRQAGQEARAGAAARQAGNVRARQTLFKTGSLISGQIKAGREAGVF